MGPWRWAFRRESYAPRPDHKTRRRQNVVPLQLLGDYASLPVQRDAPERHDIDRCAREGPLRARQLGGHKEATFPCLPARVEDAELEMKRTKSVAETTEIGSRPRVVPIGVADRKDELATTQVWVRAARSCVKPRVRGHPLSHESDEPSLAASESRSEVGTAAGAVMLAVQEAQVRGATQDKGEGRRAHEAVRLLRLGRTLAEEYLARQHDHRMVCLRVAFPVPPPPVKHPKPRP